MSSLPSSPPLAAFRKRRRFSEAPPSSDPVFSSDDLQDASVDQYDAPRKHKKKYKGTWWQNGSSQEGPGNSRQAKPRGHFERKMDSGIWMASDDTIEDDNFALPPPGAVLWAGSRGQDMAHRAKLPVIGEHKNVVPQEIVTREEEHAQQVVERALDTCSDSVDLTRLGLHSISSNTLRPLQSLTRKPRATYSPPVDDAAYEDLRPNLQLFLSWNALRTLPAELWHLENISVLSLRNNELRKLPPGISNLENLTELNLTANEFRLLPWELLSLSKKRLQQLVVYPNPFLLRCLQPGTDAVSKVFQTGSDDQTNLPKSLQELLEMESQLKAVLAESADGKTTQQSKWFLRVLQTLRQRMEVGGMNTTGSPQNFNMDPIYIASTPVAYLALDGTTASDTVRRPSEIPESDSFIDFRPLTNGEPSRKSCAPSLLELSVRTAISFMNANEIPSYLPDPLPPPLQCVVSLAESAEADSRKDLNCRTCSVCDRPYVIPRAEWIECWHWGKGTFNMLGGLKSLPHAFRMDEMFLPFIRQACSWGCADSVRIQREEENKN